MLCGDCCGGCNVGAKTTTALTYLPAAARDGAQIFTRVEVRSLTKQKDGRWRINIATRPEGGWETRMALTANVVVLGAGTLGSTEILLRSRAEGLALSERLGARFTTNGDALANAYNNDRPVNSVGVGYPAKVAHRARGPGGGRPRRPAPDREARGRPGAGRGVDPERRGSAPAGAVRGAADR